MQNGSEPSRLHDKEQRAFLDEASGPSSLSDRIVRSFERHKFTFIALLSLLAIAIHLVLRFGLNSAPDISRIPLLVTLRWLI